MSDKLRAAAQAALELLDNDDRDCAFAANILRAALAEPAIKESLTVAEQEPVACIKTNGELMWLKKPSTIYSKPRPLYAAPPRREAQERMHPEIKKMYEDYFDKCFRESSAQQRPWVGLTGDEIEDINKDQTLWGIIRTAEEILKEKNT